MTWRGSETNCLTVTDKGPMQTDRWRTGHRLTGKEKQELIKPGTRKAVVTRHADMARGNRH